MTELLTFGIGIGVGIGTMLILSFAVQPIIRKHEEAERLATTPAAFVPPRPSPAPDAVQDWKQFAKDNGWPEVAEFKGTIAGVYKAKNGDFSILVRPDFGYSSWTKETPPNPLGVLFVQAAPGYENKVIVPKPGTHVQVLWDIEKHAYFIGIIN